ncbi:MAG TPA: hypothetical protein VJ023_18305 [Pyrinomonadaceae bacterium]|nr:hypothetical protein [Pyrinomonadaceae bacterium]
MKIKISSGLLIAFALLAFATFYPTLGQNRQTARQTTRATELLASLPPADAVGTVKLRRVLDEALPKLLAPAKLAEAETHVAQFKNRTGLDPRSFEELAFAIRYLYPREGVTRLKTVAIARGTFSAGALAAAGRMAANGKYQEEHYQGKTIYIFSLDQHVRVLGLFDLRIGNLAVSPIDAGTLAIGEPQTVREFIGLKGKSAKANADLIALATREPNAIVGFGGNISAELRQNLSLTNDAIARDLTAVRQVYGAIGLGEKDLAVTLAAKTVDEYAARNLAGTVESLKQFGALFIGRLPAAKAALARSALGSMQITSQGNELQIRTSVAQTELAQLMGG